MGLSWAAEEGATASCPQVRAQGGPALVRLGVPASSPPASTLPALFPGALEIRQVLPAHAGRYTCTARSAAGTARKHLRLAVHGTHGP